MKKLFFAAALAVVAIGGALSTNAITAYSAPGAGQVTYICESNGTLCSQNVPDPVYSNSDGTGLITNKVAYFGTSKRSL